jgi:predicted transcriptional regulator
MEEKVYRQSRLCRLLGNPLAFAVVNVLEENKELSPSEIARAVGRSVSRVSHVLAALRLAEVVRYETDARQARYRLKHPRETRQLLQALAKFIDSSSDLSVTLAVLRN